MKIVSKYTIIFLTVQLLFIVLNSYGRPPQHSSIKDDDRKYVKVIVDGLACPFCAYGLEKKLKKIDGLDDLHIDIQEGHTTFTIPSESSLNEKDLKKIVSDAGFEANKIIFSDQPFPDNEK